jgi:kynurenine formamidase
MNLTPAITIGLLVAGEAGISGFENVANLDGIPPRGADILALPVKIAGGSGGPLRIVAVLPAAQCERARSR